VHPLQEDILATQQMREIQMSHYHADEGPAPRRSFWSSPYGLVLCGFLIIAGFFLLTEHTAHVFGVLPYLFLLACPLMHLFMHHGHGHHHHEDTEQSGKSGNIAGGSQ
jgi:hypothetical protein